MSLLTRYLIRHNLFLLLAILCVATGIYLLTDLFERLDGFLSVDMNGFFILWYFLIKIPQILSQLLPAVFLLALVVQLNILERSKERVALEAGGISPLVLVRFILVYSLLWAGVQLVFSEFVGVEGNRRASQIWVEDVRGKSIDAYGIGSTWFTNGNRIVYVENAIPSKGTGEQTRIYVLDEQGTAINEILQAGSFSIEKKQWILHNATRIVPEALTLEEVGELPLAIKQDLLAFQVSGSRGRPEQLPLWELGRKIKELRKAGSNVEGLLTTWHAKLAYAGSLLVMGLAGLVISRITTNIYKGIGCALIFIFIFHSINTVFSTMGESGVVSALVGAWFADVFMFALALAWFVWPLIRPGKVRLRRQS